MAPGDLSAPPMHAGGGAPPEAETPPQSPPLPPPPEASQAPAGPGDWVAGRSFALHSCVPCHVVSPDQASPIRFASAPDFVTIAKNPKISDFSLTVWLTNPHPTMPTLVLSHTEAANVIAYILSLRTPH